MDIELFETDPDSVWEAGLLSEMWNGVMPEEAVCGDE